MNLTPTDKCLCGHLEAKHHCLPVHGDEGCYVITKQHYNGIYYTFCPCREFRLDNLFYIERLAKEKGLV